MIPPKKTFYLIIVLLLTVIVGNAQTASNSSSDYLETIWTTEQGLPQNSVNAIIQSREGYLWLGTFGGLARFDGIKFNTYNSANTPGLKSNRILSLFEARDGTIWIGTQSGEIMTFKNGIGNTYTLDDGLPKGFVWAIGQDTHGTIWVGGQNGAARLVGDKFQSFSLKDGLPDLQVWAIKTDEENRTIFAVGGKFVRFDGEKFVSDQNSTDLDPHLWTAVGRRSEGGWWIGAGRKIAGFDKGLMRPLVPNSGSPSGDLRTIFEDSSGILWTSYTTPFGIYQFKNETFSPFFGKLNSDLRSMMEDSEGNLWIGTDGGGLFRLRRKKLVTLSIEDGLPSDNIRTIIDDGSGGAWIATTGGLAHWEKGRIRKFTAKDGLVSDYATALCLSRDGSLWIGSERGLTKYKDGRFEKATLSEDFESPTISIIFEDRDGRLWIGTHEGVNLLHEGRVKVFRQSDGLVNDDVRSILQSPDGTMWFGTVGGLSRLKDGLFVNYSATHGLSNEFVRDIFLNEDGSLWLATYGGGLNILKDEKITSVKSKDGLFDDFVSRILADENGNFWLLGNRGISRVSRNELNEFLAGKIDVVNAMSFGVADGMKSSEGNGTIQPAGWKMKDGRMWFPTIKGVAIIDSTQSADLRPPPVVIEQVLIDRTETPIAETIQIDPGQENVEIAYTGLSLVRPEQIRFQYKLEGLNGSWINAGTRRTAYYSYIPPGEYTFKVMANNDGVWSPAVSLKIIVYPPFWQTWWFYLFSAFAVALTILGFVRLRIHRIQRQSAAREEFSRRLINAHEGERRRIAGELHDSIGQSLAMIKNSSIFAVQAVENLEDAKEQFREITEESANAISEVREIAYNLRPHLLDRLGLTKAISSMLNKTADNLHLKMFMQIDDFDGLFESESELSIYRIIQESLNNIIKHSEATEVRVSIERNEDLINIKIEDNGKGFDVNNRNQNGFGLLGISERVRMLGGEVSIESELNRGMTTKIQLARQKGKPWGEDKINPK